MYFSLGGIDVPIECFADFEQSYDVLTSSSILRMSDGSAIKQTAWGGKLKINTSGSGWAPLGFTGLNFENPLLFKCAKPRALDGATEIITLPAARRTDSGYTPIGFAVVDNELVETPIDSLVANVATLITVANATAYRVHYWPEISVFVKEPAENWNKSGNSHGWSFEAEEV